MAGNSNSGRKPFGNKAMSAAQRSKRYYDKISAPRRKAREAFWLAFAEVSAQTGREKRSPRRTS